MNEHQEQLQWIVRQHISAAKVLVVGDPIVDHYHFGEVTKISQEAPIPVFVEFSKGVRDGGACNVLRQVKDLGGSAQGLFPDRPWTIKHRYLVGHHQVFRHDEDQAHDSLELNTVRVRELIDWCSVAILADYGKGALSETFCQGFISAMGLKHVIVDPRGGNWDKYVGATVMCPNEHEWAEHIEDRTRETRPVFPYTLLKLGRNGMQLGVDAVRDASDIIWQARSRVRQVFDVTGAGDTVIATFAAASQLGCDIKLAAELANMAAGVVVGKVGTATCSRDELLQEIERG